MTRSQIVDIIGPQLTNTLMKLSDSNPSIWAAVIAAKNHKQLTQELVTTLENTIIDRDTILDRIQNFTKDKNGA